MTGILWAPVFRLRRTPDGPPLPGCESPATKVVVFSVAAVGLLSAYAITSIQVFNPDPCVYGECARQLVAGGSLYEDVWQDKPPLAIFAYAIPQLVAPGSYAALQVFLGITLLGLGACAAAMARSAAASWLSVVILALIPLSHHDLLWASTEHFANVFVLAVLALAWRERRNVPVGYWVPWAAGAAVACAFHVRQTTLPVAIVYAAVVIVSQADLRSRLVRCGVFAAGGLSMWLMIGGLMASVGSLEGYIDTVFMYPSRYAGAGSWGAAGRLLLESAQTPLPAIAALLVAAAWPTKHRTLALGAAGVGILICILPRRDVVHYLASLLPFLVLLVWIADTGNQRTRETLKVIAIGVTVWGLLGAALSMARIVEAPSRLWMDDVVAEIDAAAPHGATLWVAGPKVATYIQFASDLPPANTFFVPFQLDPPLVDALPVPRERIMAEYLAQPPTVLVIYDEIFESLPALDHPPSASTIRDSQQLAAALLAGGRYQVRGSVNGFLVLTEIARP